MAEEKLLEALVIYPGRTRDMRSLVNISASQAKRKEGVNQDVIIRAIVYVPELDIYVAVYESPCKVRSLNPRDVRGRKEGEG